MASLHTHTSRYKLPNPFAIMTVRFRKEKPININNSPGKSSTRGAREREHLAKLVYGHKTMFAGGAGAENNFMFFANI